MTHKAYGICKNKCLVEVVTKEQFNGLIPAQASTENQLADKNFVNSSIQTETANFRGNWETWDDVPTEAESYPNDYVGNKTPTVNDYLVVKDYNGNGTWRFKYSGVWEVNGKDGWLEEYQVNATPFTAEQLASINSGITKERVERYDGMTFPVGTILSGLYASAPNGFLLCDGSEVLISDYPDLYNIIGSLAICISENEGYFKLPDMREVVLVGVGQNETLTIANHDVYGLGEFKDDQFQGHGHNLSSAVIIPTDNEGSHSGTSSWATYRDVTATTPKTLSGYGNARYGTTTHGKQFGVNYIIKY